MIAARPGLLAEPEAHPLHADPRRAVTAMTAVNVKPFVQAKNYRPNRRSAVRVVVIHD